MRLKKILKYIDNCSDIRIWISNPPYKDNEAYIAYEGPIFAMPKKYKKYHLIKTEDNGSEAIFPMAEDKFRVTLDGSRK